MTLTKSIGWIQGSLVALVLLGFAFTWAEPPAEEVNKRPSSYAPAKDLEYQLSYLMDRIKSDLKDESKYDRRVKRVKRDANTIAVLALVMGKHDEQNSLMGFTAAVIKAATQLAAKSTHHAEAKLAYGALAASVKSPAASPQVAWKSVGDIEQLMLQIPQLETSLKSALKPSRFARSREKAASIAATMAAIAQVSTFDDTYCADASDHAEWVELCACLRDAAADVHAAIQVGDPETAGKALKPLTRTCDACHDQFRD